MNILDTIIEYKRTEVAERKADVSTATLEKSAFFSRPVFSLKAALRDPGSTGIIAGVQAASVAFERGDQ